ncbi:hypothetical protein D3H55_23755 [Bacillus salacetis]|uniref:Uncharacterized protein n=1 Tax=Bacillus salacetis TaxID=2315464 RepID=A0A3A1QM56_9BACI|nr:hypothetical protein D3H55_23755 [Bacillus salacetis]
MRVGRRQAIKRTPAVVFFFCGEKKVHILFSSRGLFGSTARMGRSKKVEDERERTPEWALPMRM